MLDIRIWDVGAALSVRVKTPLGQSHLIDAGASVDFSPAQHIALNHWTDNDTLDYLIISHFDADHVRDLPNVIRFLGRPRVYLRNRTVPEVERYGTLDNEYQRVLHALDQQYTLDVAATSSPANPATNGGVDIITSCIDWQESGESFNNASVVASYFYAGWMVVFPGDIEPFGWRKLIERQGDFLRSHLDRSYARVLIAPHHGRPSGYSDEMIRYIKPSLVITSDGYGVGETDRRYYTAATGVEICGETKSHISAKIGGRKLLKIDSNGSFFIDG